MVAVVWPDGKVSSAPTWSALLTDLRRMPWNAHFKSDQEFKKEMARRAYIWCGEPLVRPSSSPKRFFEELEEAKMLRVLAPKDNVPLPGWPFIEKK
jgi:hypothetical protein